MPRLRLHAIGLGCSLLLVTGGCGGGESGGALSRDENVRAGELKSFILMQADLADGYEVQERVDATSPENCGSEGFPPGFLARLKQLGFVACAGATYRKVVTEPDRRVNRPGSLLIALKSEDAASEALPELRKGLVDSIEVTNNAQGTASVGKLEALAVSGLGDQSLPGVKIPFDLGLAGRDAELYVYVWRRNNVLGFLGSSNFLGDFSKQSTLKLAKKLDARIAK